jgi:RimJ/RimL family protein N-acetyltransferase
VENLVENLQTERLIFQKITKDHARFIRQLFNQPGYLKYVGDRGLRTDDDAAQYIRQKLTHSAEGLGFYVIGRKGGGEMVGMAGLVDREFLDCPDVGYALLEEHEGKGYAVEAAKAAVEFGLATLGLPHIGAIVSPLNHRSIALVLKLGMVFDKKIIYPGEQEAINFYLL